jgi:hypothetical protein
VTAFPPKALAALDAAYPETPARLTHGLVDHEMLTIPALVALAAALPEASAETIRSIEDNGSWMVLKRIEQHRDYAQLLRDTLAEIAPIVEPKTGAMIGLEGFVFISSPGAVTPFHFDPEHNILMQIRGNKVMTVFPAADETIVSPEAHEAFHLGQHHRNLAWSDGFAARGIPFGLAAGEAIHVPVKSPHWVKNGDEVSVSLSVTWRSDWSYKEADARAFNHVMRGIRLTPQSPLRWPYDNSAKSFAFRALRKLGLAGRG